MYKCHEQPVDGLRFDGFQWDRGNAAKCQSHEMSLVEVESLFLDAPLVGPDPFDLEIEQRWRAIGRTVSGRPAFAVFTIRVVDGERLLRPISARYMHAREARKYEQEQG
jgi:uncharacterized DUF497 family protein